MKFTKEQLQGMSDFEVNRTLASLLYPDSWIARSIVTREEISIENDEVCFVMVNYCNNPSDILPLAFQHKIGIHHFNRGMWQAYTQGDLVCTNENPLRAIACCLILVLQEDL